MARVGEPRRAAEPSAELAAEYSRKAAAYVEQWSPVIRPMALPVLDRLPLGSAKRVLDVGTGTGALVADLQTAAPGAIVVGVDRSEGMLRERTNATPFVCAVMDLEAMGIGPDTIDVALLAFVLFHTPHPMRGLREVLRALREGGAAGVVAWGDDPGLPGSAIWTEELDRAGAGPDPRDPSVMQQAKMDTLDKLTALMVNAGYDRVQTWSRRFAHQWAVHDLVATQTGCGMPARRLSGVAEADRHICERRVRARLAGLQPADLVYRPEVLYAVGQKP